MLAIRPAPQSSREAYPGLPEGRYLVSIPGVYGGYHGQGASIGAAFAKGLTFRMGQTHVHRYLQAAS